MRRLLPVATVLLAVLCPTSPALAGCGPEVVNDWLADGAIDSHHAQSCYREAIANFPADQAAYTDFLSVARAARARDLAIDNQPPPTTEPPTTTSEPPPQATVQSTPAKKPKPKPKPKPKKTTPAKTASSAPETSAATTSANPPVTAPTTVAAAPALDAVAPKDGSIPGAVLVIGGLAAVLIAAAGGGLIADRRRQRN